MSDRLKPLDHPATLGFLTVIQDASGWVGGYLTTNSWGRPLEFRLTSAVQPNRVQSVLYGATLSEYLHSELIGKALVEKTTIKPDLIVTDCPVALSLRSRVDVPVIAVVTPGGASPPDCVTMTSPRSSVPLVVARRHEGDGPAIAAILESVDRSVDLAEPFTRIREAIVEARKMGVMTRAA